MLVSMTTDRPRRRIPPKSAGAAIAARRKYLGLTQEELADRTNNIINVRLQTRLENNKMSAATLTLTKYNALVAGLQWTREEFMAATGVAPASEEIPGSFPFHPSIRVPVLGTVSAGLASIGGEMDDVETMPVDLEASGLRGINPDSLVWLIVNGDSMVSETAGRHVPPGSRVLVEVGGLPTDGDLVIAYLGARDTYVVKKFREQSQTVLRSLNPSGPVFRLGDEPLEIRGVVKLIQYKPGG